MLLLFALAYCEGASIRAILSTSPSLYQVLYGTLDSQTGRFNLTANWTLYGPFLGGHSWASDDNKNVTAIFTLLPNSDKSLLLLFSKDGVVLSNFTADLAFSGLEYSIPQQGFVTTTMVNRSMSFARLNWNRTPHVIPRILLPREFYEQIIDVCCMDHKTGIMYIVVVSDETQEMLLVGVDTSSWMIHTKAPIRNLPGFPWALEYFGGNVIATVRVTDGSNFWLEVFRIDPSTGHSTSFATLPVSWSYFSGASAIDPKSGVLYLGVGNTHYPPTLWRVASIDHAGSVSFSQAFHWPILSLLH